MKTQKVISNSPEETQALAASLAVELKSGAVLALHGELGSGKTCFVQGLARALGVRQPVTSPTFTIVNEYRGRCPLVHMDLYRIGDPDELLSLDFENYLNAEGITVIEWAERWSGLGGERFRRVQIDVLSETERRISYEDSGA